MNEYQSQDYSKQNADWQKSQDLNSQYIGSLQKQAEVAQQGVGNVQQAQQGALDAYNYHSGQAIAANRGLLGGGKGLASLRQAALERGVGQGQLRAQYAGAINEAQAKAAGAQTELIGEKQKQIQAAALRQQKVNSALDSARAILTAEAGDQWFTFNSEDRARTANRIRKEVLATETDPMVIQAVEQYIADLQTGKTDVKGVADT